MRLTALVLVSCVLIGCAKTPSPHDAVQDLIAAIGTHDTKSLGDLVSRDSRVMIRTNLTRTNGLAVFLTQASSQTLGQDYVLAAGSMRREKAIVLLQNGRGGLPVFKDRTLPPKIAKDGLAIFLVKEGGRWRVDLHTSESRLLDIGIDRLLALNGGKLPDSAPAWFPSPPGMPSPPGYREHP